MACHRCAKPRRNAVSGGSPGRARDDVRPADFPQPAALRPASSAIVTAPTSAASGTGASAAPTLVNPNLDVVYSEAWVAVHEQTPAILTVPKISGRYYTAQIVDEWAEIVHNVNDRNFPDHPAGRFAICPAGSSPDVPDDCVRLDVPTGKAKLLARVQIGDDV